MRLRLHHLAAALLLFLYVVSCRGRKSRLEQDPIKFIHSFVRSLPDGPILLREFNEVFPRHSIQARFGKERCHCRAGYCPEVSEDGCRAPICSHMCKLVNLADKLDTSDEEEKTSKVVNTGNLVLPHPPIGSRDDQEIIDADESLQSDFISVIDSQDISRARKSKKGHPRPLYFTNENKQYHYEQYPSYNRPKRSSYHIPPVTKYYNSSPREPSISSDVQPWRPTFAGDTLMSNYEDKYGSWNKRKPSPFRIQLEKTAAGLSYDHMVQLLEILSRFGDHFLISGQPSYEDLSRTDTRKRALSSLFGYLLDSHFVESCSMYHVIEMCEYCYNKPPCPSFGCCVSNNSTLPLSQG